MVETAILKEQAEYLTPRQRGVVAEAEQFLRERLAGREGLLKHSLGSALLLAELGLDAPSIAAALLHHLPPEGGAPVQEIETRFGPGLARLVDGVVRLASLPPAVEGGPGQAENLRKMLLALAQDLRVVLVRLAEEQETLSRVQALPPSPGQALARYALEVYAPLAQRMGIARLYREMEDTAFAYLEPERFQEVAGQVAESLKQWQEPLLNARREMAEALSGAGIPAEITSRTKHIYSTYQKRERYASLGRGMGDIHDLVALRVVVETEAECYSALGILHSRWHPLPGEFNDFIANPKENGYQSLHTTIVHQGVPIEVQIRTQKMHQIAEYGLAAHWKYKEGGKGPPAEWITRVRRFLAQHPQLSDQEILESLQADVFSDRVLVYTPKGEIKELPAGATPLDFAYYIHTELGHRCIGAKVNGRMVPLTHPLQSGDRVEVLTSRSAKAPSRDWLNPALGYVKTIHARDKVRQWFRHQERQENIERGRELLEREFKRLGLAPVSYEELARLFHCPSGEDFLAALGDGDITPHQIAQKLVTPPPPPRAEAPSTPQPLPLPVRVDGVGNLLTHIAACCHPLPGDPVIGYVTRGRGLSIHRRHCPSLSRGVPKERLLAVEWGRQEAFYPAVVEVRAWDRVGLLRDIGVVVAEEGVNIQDLQASQRGDHTAHLRLTLQAHDIAQLSRLLARMEAIKGVISAVRSGPALK